MAMSSAEKSRRYKERRKQKGYKQCNRWVKPGETIDPSKSHENGRIKGVCEAAAYFINTKYTKAATARRLLEHFGINRETAVTIMEPDALESLDNAKVWDKLPDGNLDVVSNNF